VYTTTQEEAEASKNGISGTISINDKKAYALFDTGVTHSFVFESYRRLGEIGSTSLDMPLHISMPLKDVVLSTLICEKCKISISGLDQEIDLVVMVMYDFDVIIGMDWLHEQRAKVDCYRKMIPFNPLN